MDFFEQKLFIKVKKDNIVKFIEIENGSDNNQVLNSSKWLFYDIFLAIFYYEIFSYTKFWLWWKYYVERSR